MTYRIKILFVLFPVLLLFSCGLIRTEGKKTAGQDLPDESIMLSYRAAWNSYDIKLDNDYPKLEEIQDFEAVQLPHLNRSFEAAYTGQYRYWVENAVLLKRSSYMGTVPEENDYRINDQDYGPSEAQWEASHRISAGPLVFRNRILIATLKPAFHILDSLTLSELYTVELDAIPVAPIKLESDLTQLLVSHADGSSGRYRISKAADTHTPKTLSSTALDPVEMLIQPESAVLKEIEQSFSQLRSLGSEQPFKRIDVYDPRMTVDSEGAVLFCYHTGLVPKPLRIYIDDAMDRPYVLAVYDKEGQRILSNIEYQAAKLIELLPIEAADYYIAAAFLGTAPEEPETAPLRIVERDR